MIAFEGEMILLDIEGTVSPLAFVHEVMFPYARQNVAQFLAVHGDEPETLKALHQMAQDAGCPSFEAWCPFPYHLPETRTWIVNEVHRLMDLDAKQTGLKQLQGLIWQQGFHAGDLRATLFEDVSETLEDWQGRGVEVRIYSSGSVHAQKLFFQHTVAGDLSPHMTGWYDTSTGSKREAASYVAIAQDSGRAPEGILFVSDVPEELDAARAANLQTALAIRPGNRETKDLQHPRLHSLRDIVFP